MSYFSMQKITLIALALPGVLLGNPAQSADLKAGGEPVSQAQAVSGDAASKWRENSEESARWGGRMAYIDKKSDLRARQVRNENLDWAVLASNVKAFQLMDNRVGVLLNDGKLLFNIGALNTPLRLLDEDVAAFQISENRFGILSKAGDFKVREPGFEPYVAAQGIKAFHISPEGIAVLGLDNSLWVSKGSGLPLNFQKVADNVQAFQFEREWLGYVTDGGKLMLGKLDLFSPTQYSAVMSGVADFEMEVFVDASKSFLSTAHLAAINANGTIFVGQSDKAETLSVQAQSGMRPAKNVKWAGQRLITETAAGVERAKFAGGKRLAGEKGAAKLEQAVLVNAEGLAVRRRAEGVFVSAEDAPIDARTGVVIDKASERQMASAIDAEEFAGMQQSSMRPRHLKRPVSASVQAQSAFGASGTPPVFSGPPELKGMRASGN